MDLTQGYSIRPYEPGEEKDIVDLLELVFNGWPYFDLDCSPLDHWRWKHLYNPVGRSIVYVSESEGEIVGSVSTCPIKLKLGNRIFMCGFAADTAVHPNYRNKGLYKALNEAKKAQEVASGLDIHIGMTKNIFLIKRSKRSLRNTIPFGVTNFIRIKDVDLYLKMSKISRAWLKKYILTLKKKVNVVTNFSKPAYSDVDIYPVKAFDERMKPFWSNVSGQNDLILDRSLEYLNWRYCDGRAGRFTVKLAGKDDILGYAVLRTNRKAENPYGIIDDLIAVPNRLDVVDALLEDAINHFDESVNVIRCMMLIGHPYTKILKKHGFVDSRDRPYFTYEIFKDLNGFDIKKMPLNRMHFMSGDFD